MLEEDERPANRISDCAVHQGTSSTDGSGVRMSYSPISRQECSFDSNSVVQRDSLTDESTHASRLSVSTKAASTALLNEDPWLPLSTEYRSPGHRSARNRKSLSSSHLQCCSSAAATVPQFATGYDSENLCSERSAASYNPQCRCGDERLQTVPETNAVDVDEVINSNADLQQNLAEIEKGETVNCFDTEHVANHPCSAACVRHSFRQSDADHFPTTRADDSPGTSCYSQLPSSWPRPARKASLDGLKKAVRSVLVHRTSLIPERPANLADCDRGRSPVENFPSEISDPCSVPSSTEKCNRSTGSKQLSKIDRRQYFGSGRRSQRCGLAVDSVRQSLTHLLRTADHGSSVVGERMAVSCLERPVSNTLTLTGTKRTFGRVLNSNLDDVEATESCRLLPELSRSLSGTDNQSDAESDGVTTTANLSELDTSDSFYESRLFDALEAQENIDGGGSGGGFDTDSSDDGTYSAESFSDLAPSDDQPTSSTSSHRSVDVDDPSSRTAARQSRQSDPALTDISGHDEHHAPVAATAVVTSHLLRQTVRQRSSSDVNSRRLTELTGGSRSSWTALQQTSRGNNTSDSALSQQRWKRLSL